MSDTFDQAAYWIKRHEDLKGDPRSVGNLGASREANEAGEPALKYIVSSIAQRLASTGAKTVLDLGCGYGRIAGCFIDNGYAYTGVDISPVATQTGRENHPTGTFLTGNLSELNLTEKFDVVTVLYVFVHFVDDKLWREFLSAAVSRLKPGGTLVFADHFPAEKTKSGHHVVGRPFSAYEEALPEERLTFNDGLRSFVLSLDKPGCGHFHFANSEPRTRVFQRGQTDSFDGRSLEDNPYSQDDERHEWWIDGYKTGNTVGYDYSKA